MECHLVQQVLALVMGQVVVAQHVVTVLLLHTEAQGLQLAVQQGTQAEQLTEFITEMKNSNV